jgi:RHS repeat-associated protein
MGVTDGDPAASGEPWSAAPTVFQDRRPESERPVAPAHVALASTTSASSAAVLSVRRLSVSPGGVEANGSSNYASVSADGRWVAFSSSATNLVAGDTNGVVDVFVVDRDTGAVELVSAGSAGLGNGDSWNPRISDDGRFVAFNSKATNLSAGDANGAVTDVLVRDREAATTVVGSILPSGAQSTSVAYVVSDLSGDGRSLAFLHDDGDQVLVRDLSAGSTIQVTRGLGAGRWAGLASTNADGSVVSFATNSSAPRPSGFTYGGGFSHTFAWSPPTAAVAELVTRSFTPGVSATCRDTSRCPGNGPTAVDSAGRHVVYATTREDIVDGDSGVPGTDSDSGDVYRFDRATGRNVWISERAAGFTGDSGDPDVSADGALVAFESEVNALLGDTRTRVDVYVKNLATGDLVLAPGASSSHDNVDPAISADGGTVAFTSTNPALVPGDTNSSRDIFVLDTRPLLGPLARVPAEQTFGSGCDRLTEDWTSRWGYPVNTATGAETLTVTDAELPAPGVRCGLTRSYTSLDTRAGPLGPGWTHTFNSELLLDETGVVTYRGPSGQRARFTEVPGGGYSAAVGVRGTLERDGSSGWVLTYPDQHRLNFDSTGRLVRIVDRTGTGVALSYADGILASAIDAADRTVTFTHSGGLLTRMTLPDGTYVAYTYTDGRLTEVRDLRGGVTTYAYDSSGRLSLVRDPVGAEVRTVYDDGTGRVVRQTDPRGQTTTYAWNPATETATVTRPDGGVWVEDYAGNILRSRTDPQGNTTFYRYDTALNLLAVTDERGRVTAMTYDANGNMLSRTTPRPVAGTAGFAERWTYNASRDVTSVTDRRGNRSTMTYDDRGLLTTVTDAVGGTVTYAYNDRGQPTSITDQRGHSVSLSYDSDGDLVAVESPTGARTTFEHDVVGRLVRAVSPLGNIPGADPAQHTTSYTYEDGDLVSSITDPTGATSVYTYDAAGRRTSSTDPLGRTTKFEHDEAGNLVATTDPLGAVWRTTYDPVGRIVEDVTPAGRTAYSYDTVGNLLTESTPRGNEEGADASRFRWTHSYDAVGNQTSTTDPLGRTTRFTYDGLDRVTAVTDARGNVARVSYDGNGNVTARTDGLGNTTSYAYDALDRLTRVTDPRGASFTTTFEYSPTGERLSETRADGARWQWEYDEQGRMIGVVDPRGTAFGATAADYTTSFAYDAFDRLVAVTDPLGNTTRHTYDAVGRRTATTDPRGGVTTWSYLPDGALASVDGPGPLGPTTYDYDVAQNLTSRTDANGHRSTFTYDAARRLTAMTLPDGRSWRYAHDAAGNRTETETPLGTGTTDPGDGLITASFDALERLAGIDYSDSTPDVTIEYDAVGNRSRMTDGEGETAYTYDAANRLGRVDRNGDVISYAYDAAGHVIRRAYPNGTVQSLAYDATGRLGSIDVDGVRHVTYGYDPAGRPTSADVATGVRHSWSYDRAGRPTAVESRTAETVLSAVTATLDPAGNPVRLTTVRPGVAGPVVDGYTYDLAGQVVRQCPGLIGDDPCDAGVGSVVTTYDRVGNRLAQSRTGLADPGVTEYSYDAADRLTGVSRDGAVTPVTTDALGNVTRDSGGRAYTWDLAGRLTSVDTGTQLLSYGYNGDGRQVANGPSVVLWDEVGSLPQPAVQRATTDDSGTSSPVWQRSWVHGLDGTAPVSVTATSSDGTRFTGTVHPGWLGTPLGVSDADAATVARADFDIFGVGRWSAVGDQSLPDWSSTSGTTALESPAQAVVGVVGAFGELSDPGTETGAAPRSTPLVHLRARTMDPAIGRFLSSDPLQPVITDPYVSSYVYAVNRPGVLADPTGQCSILNWLRDRINHGQGVMSNLCQREDATAIGPDAYREFVRGQDDLTIGAVDGLNDAMTFGLRPSVRDRIGDCGLDTSWYGAGYWGASAAAVGFDVALVGGAGGYVGARAAVESGFGARAPSRLFRGDSRPPHVVFQVGFQPRGGNNDLYAHAAVKGPSDFVATSPRRWIAADFANDNPARRGWVYEIVDAPGSVSVRRELGRRNPYAIEAEYVFRGVPPSYIRSAQEVRWAQYVGEPVLNPGYRVP